MMQRLVPELRRRRVLRVAGAYTVAGWVALQAAEVLMPALALPEWTVSFVAVLLLLGLPLSIALAWILQPPHATPDDPSAGAPLEHWRWTDAVLIVGVGIAVAITAVQVTVSGGRVVSAPAAVAPLTDSVAVLPFASFSDDPGDGYFADGLTEELINSLAQVPGLKVPGRTSSFYFKNANEDLRDIGRQLGVAHVLEGSVRRGGDKLRVTVQLISAADGFHLWSRTYDRELNDVLAIQHDIATQVAATLELTLRAGGEPQQLVAGGASYASYLVARARLQERTLTSVTEARRLFEEMLLRQPEHVEALAGYARSTIILAGAFLAVDFEPSARSAVAAVERALTLEPDSVAANLAAGHVYYVLGFRTDEQHYVVLAERALTRAVDLAPNDAEVLRTYGGLLAQLGRWQAALDIIERAVANDPLDRAVRLMLAEALRGVGRLGDARLELEQVLAADRAFIAAHLELGELLVETGSLDLAVPHLQVAHRDRSSPRASLALANAYLNLDMPEASQATLAELDYAPLSMPLGRFVQLLGHGDEVAALALAEAELERTNDRLWRPSVVLLALTTGDLGKAREHLRRLEPAVLGADPDIARLTPSMVLMAANLLLREGREAQAAVLLQRLLQRFAAPAEGFDPVASKLVRAQALAQLGRDDEALAELAAARLQGYRTLVDFDYFLRLDRYPAFAGLRDDGRFKAFLDAVLADNRTTRQRLAGREGPQPGRPA